MLPVSLHYLVKYKWKKKNNNRQQACWWTKYTFNQKCSKWSVRCYILLDPFLWISDVLDDMFVSGLCGLASLPFHPQWSRSLQYVYASVCRSHAVGLCCMCPKSVLITFPRFFGQFIFENSAVFSENGIFGTGTSS